MELYEVVRLIRGIAFFAGLLGILVGLDLLFGVKIVSGLQKILDKAVDFDKIILQSKAKIILGTMLLILSVLIILLIKA